MSGFGSAATTVVAIVAALAIGGLIGSRRSGRDRARSRMATLEWWPALVVGIVGRVLVELVAVPGGLVVLIGSSALLLAVCLKNLDWTGTPLVALGLVTMLVPTVVNGGMPVSRDALAQMGHRQPPAALPGERHLEVARDQLLPLGDVLPLPLGGRPVSFGELIVLVGLGNVAFNAAARHAAGRGRRRPARRLSAPIEAPADARAELTVLTDPLEEQGDTVVVLGPAPAGRPLPAERRPIEPARSRPPTTRPPTTRAEPSPTAFFDVEADPHWLDERVGETVGSPAGATFER